MVLYSLAAGGTLIIYLRFFCGWRLGDLMYVTRASLSRSLTSVTAGVCLPRLSHLFTRHASQSELQVQRGVLKRRRKYERGALECRCGGPDAAADEHEGVCAAAGRAPASEAGARCFPGAVLVITPFGCLPSFLGC